MLLSVAHSAWPSLILFHSPSLLFPPLSMHPGRSISFSLNKQPSQKHPPPLHLHLSLRVSSHTSFPTSLPILLIFPIDASPYCLFPQFHFSVCVMIIRIFFALSQNTHSLDLWQFKKLFPISSISPFFCLDLICPLPLCSVVMHGWLEHGKLLHQRWPNQNPDKCVCELICT